MSNYKRSLLKRFHLFIEGQALSKISNGELLITISDFPTMRFTITEHATSMPWAMADLALYSTALPDMPITVSKNRFAIYHFEYLYNIAVKLTEKYHLQRLVLASEVLTDDSNIEKIEFKASKLSGRIWVDAQLYRSRPENPYTMNGGVIGCLKDEKGFVIPWIVEQNEVAEFSVPFTASEWSQQKFDTILGATEAAYNRNTLNRLQLEAIVISCLKCVGIVGAAASISYKVGAVKYKNMELRIIMNAPCTLELYTRPYDELCSISELKIIVDALSSLNLCEALESTQKSI